MDWITSSVTGWVEANAAWAPLIVFTIAFVESVPLIGLFVPGSALLLGVGLLVGSGVLPAWPILAAAILGGVLGDAGGFWLCRWLGPRFVRTYLPRRYRRIYGRGVLAFRRWGMGAVFIARFISPLRAVAPIIAGVTRMREWRFQLANIASALIWAPAVLFPGVAAGHLAVLLEDRGDAIALGALGLAVLLAWLVFRSVWARVSLPR